MASTSILRRAISTTNVENVIKQVTVVGAGLMGSGIAQVSVQAGLNVNLVDLNKEALKKSEDNINASIIRVAKKQFKDDAAAREKFVTESLSKLNMTTDLNKSLEDCDLMIEAVVENLELKRKLFKDVENVVPQKTILASNTSSYLISDITEGSTRQDRLAGLHFFNPVPVMKLLEVVRLPETSDDTFNKLTVWGQFIGKTTIACKDTPGFVVNRLLVPMMAEACRMIERGDCTIKDLDIAMKLGAGFPMGPFELADYTGIDTFKFILDGWHKKFPDNPLFVPSEMVNKLVGEGKFGRKTGEGFFCYQK